MNARRITTALASAAAIGLLAAPAAGAAPTGTTSLAAVLTSDGNSFDTNWGDFDIVTEAVLAVLENNPKSAVGVLADGTVPLTAFAPTDRAFQLLAKDLTGRWHGNEQAVFGALAKRLGLGTIEKVLLYHVAPGATIDAATALKADNARLKTALGSTFRVDVVAPKVPLLMLRDRDLNDRDPRVNVFDVNKGNKQIAHGIDRVLRPVNL